MATAPGPHAYRTPAQPGRPFDLGYLITVQRAWARELANEDITRIPTFNLAWYKWIGRPHHHVLSASGHIIEAQKAWAAEQTRRQLPKTQAAWDAWIADPIREAWAAEQAEKQLPGTQAAWAASNRPLDLEHLFAAKKAWAREQCNFTLALDSNRTWHEWLGRPDGHLLPCSGLIVAAQKAWAAEQTKKQLPRTQAAWETWIADPDQDPDNGLRNPIDRSSESMGKGTS